MPFYSTRGTKRSDLNNELIPRSEDNQFIMRYISFKDLKVFGDMTLDEFICPYYSDDDPHGRVTTEYCEALGMKRGCKNIVSCASYLEQKKLQVEHPEIDWKEIYKNTPEKLSIIKMIKDKIIILPEKKDDKTDDVRKTTKPMTLSRTK